MTHKFLDISKWARKNAFEFYIDFDDPYFNVTMNIDVTEVISKSKEKKQSSFLSCIFYCIKAANEIDNFKMRIEQDKIKIYSTIHGGSTLIYDDESFGFCYYDFVEKKSVFLEESEKRIRISKELKSFDPSNKRDDLIYFSSLPWVQFTSIKHAQDKRINASIPRISFGKYFQKKDRILMPLNVEVNHALMDGYHLGKYIELLQKYMHEAKG